MKSIYITLIAIILSVVSYAQAPNAINYQAAVRDGNGDVVANELVSFRISLLQGSVTGTAVYTETHTATSNNYGLVNLEFGNGTSTDDFSSVNWATGPYFVKIELDIAGGTNYVEMGASQMLSVPYAKYAEVSGNATLPQYTQAEINALTPVAGMMVYNTDYNMLQFYDGSQWNGNQNSGCVPAPNNPIAGEDQIGLSLTSIVLSANTPNLGATGEWSVVSGTGGSFVDVTDPNTTFSGNDLTTYVLKWSIMTECETLSDEVSIEFGGLLSSSNYQWERIGGADGTGLDVFGLKWTANAKAIHAQITKNGAEKLVLLDYSQWNSITTQNLLIDAIEAGTDVSVYEGVDVGISNPEINDVIGVKYNSEYYLILIGSNTSIFTTQAEFLIEGQYKD